MDDRVRRQCRCDTSSGLDDDRGQRLARECAPTSGFRRAPEAALLRRPVLPVRPSPRHSVQAGGGAWVLFTPPDYTYWRAKIWCNTGVLQWRCCNLAEFVIDFWDCGLLRAWRCTPAELQVWRTGAAIRLFQLPRARSPLSRRRPDAVRCANAGVEGCLTECRRFSARQARVVSRAEILPLPAICCGVRIRCSISPPGCAVPATTRSASAVDGGVAPTPDRHGRRGSNHERRG